MKICRIILCAPESLQRKKFEYLSNKRYILYYVVELGLAKIVKRLVYNIITRCININSFNIFFRQVNNVLENTFT